MRVVKYGGFVDIEETEAGTFDARVQGGRFIERAYGGSVLANTVAALSEWAGEGRDIHSLHGYFLRPVDSQAPLVFAHQTIREGRNYSVHRLQGAQNGKTAVDFTASFKVPTPSAHDRQPQFPDVPGPDGLPDGFQERAADLKLDDGLRQSAASLPETIESRQAPVTRGVGTGELLRHNWYRMRQPFPDTAVAHAAALAYVCDVNLVPTAVLRFEKGEVPPHVIASLDHAMWFHEPPRFDGWVLYAQHSRVERDGRTWAHGDLWTQDGRLLASVAQEALLLIDDPLE